MGRGKKPPPRDGFPSLRLACRFTLLRLFFRFGRFIRLTRCCRCDDRRSSGILRRTSTFCQLFSWCCQLLSRRACRFLCHRACCRILCWCRYRQCPLYLCHFQDHLESTQPLHWRLSSENRSASLLSLSSSQKRTVKRFCINLILPNASFFVKILSLFQYNFRYFLYI